MATKKKSRSRRKSRPKKKRAGKRIVIIRRTVVKKIGSKKRGRSSSSSGKISRAKKTIKEAAGRLLKDALYERDCATSYKQHRTAQKKVDKARKEMRKAS